MLNILKSTPVSVPLLTGLIYLLLSLCGLYIDAETVGEDSVFLVIIIVQIVVFAVPSFLYYGIKGGKLNYPVVSGKLGAGRILFAIGAMGVMFFGCLLIKLLFYSGGVQVGNDKGYLDALYKAEDGAVGLFLAYALIPALCEEFFFRGIVLSEYKKYGSFNAVLISALYFTMVHFTTDGFLVYFYAGLILGVTTSVCRSIYPAVAMHTLFNAYYLYSSPSFISTMVFNTGTVFLGFVLLVALLISFVFMFSRLELLYRAESKLGTEAPMPEKSINHLYLYITPALIVPIAVFIIINALMK